MPLSRIHSPSTAFIAVESRIVRQVATNTFHEIYNVIGEAMALDRLKQLQPNATYCSWDEFMSLPELPRGDYQFSPSAVTRETRPDMRRGTFWIWRIADQVFEVEAFEIDWTDGEAYVRSLDFNAWVPIASLIEPSPLTRRIWL